MTTSARNYVDLFIESCIVITNNATDVLSYVDINDAYIVWNRQSSYGTRVLLSKLERYKGVVRDVVNKRFTHVVLVDGVVKHESTPLPTLKDTHESTPLPTLKDTHESTPLPTLKDTHDLSPFEKAKLTIEAHKVDKEYALAIELKQMELDAMRDLYLEHLRFMNECNNKNRPLFGLEHHHRYLDLEVFGTPSEQYVDGDSLFRVCGNTMFSERGITQYEHTFIGDIILERLIDVTIIFENCERSIKALSVVSAIQVVHLVELKLHANLQSVIDQLRMVISFASRDDNRSVPSGYIRKRDAQRSMSPKLESKEYYMRGDVVYDNAKNDYLVTCGICNNTQVYLRDNSCHRCHNIPKADGGSCDRSNIVLGCANCNASMSNDKTIDEVHADMFATHVSSFKYARGLTIVETYNGRSNWLSMMSHLSTVLS